MLQEQVSQIREHVATRDIKKAEVNISKLLRLDLSPDVIDELHMLRAKTRLFSARPEEALDDLAQIRRSALSPNEHIHLIELEADCYFARFELASPGFADRQHLQQSLERYQSIIDQHPNYENLGWVLYQKGRVLLTNGQNEAAIECLRAALFEPSTLPTLTAYCFERLGFLSFYEQREPARALSFLNKAIATYPAQEDPMWLVRVYTLRSRILRVLKQPEQALASSDHALTLAAGNADHKLALADVLLANAELLHEIGGRDRDAVMRLQEFLQASKKPLGIDVTWSRAHEMLGDAYFKLGQFASAAGAYQDAIQYNPYHPWELSLHYRTARAYYQSEQYQQAVHVINHMLDVAQNDNQPISDYRVYNVLGSAHFALKNYTKAVNAYREALNMAPPTAELDQIRCYHKFAEELSLSV
jgi:tetratricopeptide (TPR) repeat protein